MNELHNGLQRLRAVVSPALPERLPPLDLIIAGVAVLWFSLPTVASLNASWLTDADYSYGYIIALLTALLVAREVRATAAISSSWAGVLCLLGLVVAVLVGHGSSTTLLAQVALPLLWMSSIWAFMGASNARRLSLPLCYFYFAVPIWSLLIDPLRMLTIAVVSAWMRAGNLPAFIEGNLVHVPTGTFEVEGGCAGLRYLLVAAALSIFRGYWYRRPFVPALLFTLASLVLALVGNWLRVFITVAAGLSPEHPILRFVHDNHTLFGWILFMVFMAPLFWVDRLPPESAKAPPTQELERLRNGARPRRFAYLGYAVLAAGIWLGQRIRVPGDAPVATVLSRAEVAGWEYAGSWGDSRVPAFVGTSAELAVWYKDDATRIGAYIAEYTSQRQGHEAVFLNNRPEGQFGVITARHADATVASAGGAVPFRQIEVSDPGGELRLVWLGFRVAGTPTAHNWEAKALQAAGAIRGRRDAQVLVLTASCGSDCIDARASLSRFAAAAAQPLYERAEESGVSRATSSARGSR